MGFPVVLLFGSTFNSKVSHTISVALTDATKIPAADTSLRLRLPSDIWVHLSNSLHTVLLVN